MRLRRLNQSYLFTNILKNPQKIVAQSLTYFTEKV